jgi:xyloglucan-specific endo-beta-1,4-glucanase
MRFYTTIIAAVMAASAIATPTPVVIEKRATTMCGSWGTVATAGYTVYHNNWGAGKATSGSQCTTFNSVSSALSFSWSTSWTWTGGAGQVKSYSNVALEAVNKKISAINTIPSTWTWRFAFRFSTASNSS